MANISKINFKGVEYDIKPLMDAEPTTGSTNAVQSGGVKSALDEIQAEIPTVDAVPTQGSDNAVSSGGVYSALHETDTTLTQSGQAADAAVVGEKFTDLKSALADLDNGLIPFNPDINNWYRGYFSASGTFVSNNGNAAPTNTPFAVSVGDVLKIYPYGMKVQVQTYSYSEGVYTRKTSIVYKTDQTLTYDANTYVAIHVLKVDGTTLPLSEVTTKIYEISNIEKKISEISENEDALTDLKSSFEYSVRNGAILFPVTTNGNYTAAGLTTGNAKRIRTDLIPFESGDVINIKNDGFPHACGMWEGTVSQATIRRNDDNFNASDEAIECGYSGYIVVVFKRTDNSDVSPSDFTGSVSDITAKTYLRPLYDGLEQKIDKESINLVSTHLGELCPVEGVTTGTYLTMSTSDGEPIGLNPRQTNISFYDSNKSFIDQYGFTQGLSVRTIGPLSAVFADVKYIAITNNEPRVPIMLNVGRVALPYQPYYSNISTITDDVYNLKSITQDEKIQKESYAVVDSLSHHVTSNGQPSKVALSVLWATDIHAEVERTRRMIELANTWNNFDVVINTGDTASALYSDGVTWYDNIVIDSNVPVLNTVGNHDAWTDLNGALAPRTDVYNMIIAPVAEQTEIVQPDNAAVNGLCYYYKDVNGIRIIVLDCMYWDADELTWFANTLNSTTVPVIVCVHYPFSANARTLADSIWNTGIPNVSASVVPLTAAEAVQTFMASGGTFICWLQGHSHADRIGVLTGYGNQLCLQATSFTNRETLVYKGTNTAEYNYDALTAITIDTTDKTLKMYRIGANINGVGQKYNSFAWNYETTAMLADW